MSWKVTVQPAAEPLTLAQAKAYLGITWDDIDDEIEAAIRDARDWCEQYLDLAIPEQTITYYLDKFPSTRVPIELPRSNLIEVESVTYTDPDGATITVATSVYGVDTASVPGRIYLKQDQEWPWDSTAIQDQAVQITYVAGYRAESTGTSTYPGAILRAMKLLIGHWNENHEGSIVGVSVAELPLGVAAALDKHKAYGV